MSLSRSDTKDYRQEFTSIEVARNNFGGRFDDTYVTKHALLSIILSVALIFCHFFSREKERNSRTLPSFKILAPRTDVFRTVSARASLKPVHKKFATARSRTLEAARGGSPREGGESQPWLLATPRKNVRDSPRDVGITHTHTHTHTRVRIRFSFRRRRRRRLSYSPLSARVSHNTRSREMMI